MKNERITAKLPSMTTQRNALREVQITRAIKVSWVHWKLMEDAQLPCIIKRQPQSKCERSIWSFLEAYINKRRIQKRFLFFKSKHVKINLARRAIANNLRLEYEWVYPPHWVTWRLVWCVNFLNQHLKPVFGELWLQFWQLGWAKERLVLL